MTYPPDALQKVLGERYVLDRQVGRGRMAVVYLAEDQRYHRRVAVKALRPELAASLAVDRFLREIQTAARLQHPKHSAGAALTRAATRPSGVRDIPSRGWRRRAGDPAGSP